MNDKRAVLMGCGVTAGPVEIENERFSRIMDTNDQWIRERTGIERRWLVEPGTSSSDLGVVAAQRAIEEAGIEAAEIDYIVCATMTPDHYFPGCATLIQKGIGIDPVPALDLRQQCAGFAYGLQMVDVLVRSGTARTVLLVGTDVHSSLMPFTDRTWEVLLADEEIRLDGADQDEREQFEWNTRFRHLVVLFGDAAGAMVFRASEADDGRGILGADLKGDGDHWKVLHVPGLGSRSRPMVDHEMLRSGDWVPVMEGRTVFKLAAHRMPAVTLSLLDQHGYGLEDLDLLVMHQANLRINEAAQKVLGLPDEKVFNNIQNYGNTTSATLPLCFHDARQAGKAQPGELVAFTALGAGLHWGSVLLRV